MEYKVLNAMKSGEFDGQYGKTYKYSIMFEGQEEAAEMNQKPDTPAPKAGDILSGTIEDTQYGKKFKKERTSGFGGSNGKNDPATQKAIIRQNALTNAVNYCIAKANIDKTFQLSGKEVIQVATYFARYSEGTLTIVTESEKPKQEVVTARDEEIDIDEIPFPEEN